MKLIKYSCLALAVNFFLIANSYCNPVPSGAQVSIIAPTTITQPGSYVLSFDIVGTITIDADRVYLDLNQKRVDGGQNNIVVASGHSDITIHNGNLSNPEQSGLVANDTSNLTVENIVFVGGTTPIFINTSTCINLNNITISQSEGGGIFIDSSEVIEITNITAQNNSSAINDIFSIAIFNSQNAKLSNLLISENSSINGFCGGITAQFSRDIQISQATITNLLGAISTFGVVFFSSQKATCSDIFVGNHTTTAGESFNTSAGFLCIFDCIDISFNNCQAHQLHTFGVAGQGGFSSFSSSRIQCNNCIVSNLESRGGVAGFRCEGGNNALYDHCVSTTNFSTDRTVGFEAQTFSNATYNSCITTNNISIDTAESYGFSISNCDNVISNLCIANDNSSTTTAYGFSFVDTATSCLLQGIAKNNNGSNTGRGIYLLNCFGCFVEKNIVAANTGSSSSVGIEVSNSGGVGDLSTSIFCNQAQDHTLNYVIDPGDILTVDYTRSDATISAPPTPFDNLNIF